MKLKNHLYSLAAVLCMIGCNDESATLEDAPSTVGFGNRISGFSATIVAGDHTSEEGTAGNQQVLIWKTGNTVTLTDRNSAAEFGVAAGIGTSVGQFKGALNSDSTILYALYPSAGTQPGPIYSVTVAAQQDALNIDPKGIMIGSGEDVKPGEETQIAFRRKTATVTFQFAFTTDEATYAAEKIKSVKIVAEGAPLVGTATVDFADPDAALSGSSGNLTLTFSQSPGLDAPIEASFVVYPCDLRAINSVLYLVSTDNYTFLFNKRPGEAFSEGGDFVQSLALRDFVPTTSETPADGEVKITHELPALDLSADGTANCYLVDKEARCSFKATVMGNGAAGILPDGGFTDYLGNALASSAQIEPVSAELLWQTVDGLISELTLSDGIVSFNTSTDKGNALIAVKDSEGRIMWSWHIWCTDRPADLTCMTNQSGNSYTFMDRNLGATSNADNTGSLGLLYQWGRKDPLPGASQFYSLEEPTLYGTVTAVTLQASDASTGTIAYAIQHPVTMIYASDWLFAGRNDALWGNPQGETELTTDSPKTIYDPCPPGYKLPGKDAYTLFTRSGENTKDPNDHNVVNTSSSKHGWYLYYSAEGSGDQNWYPYNGCRYYNTGVLNRGSYYYYWTSAPSSGTKACCLSFKNDWKEVNPLYTWQRGNANTTRCVKE